MQFPHQQLKKYLFGERNLHPLIDLTILRSVCSLVLIYHFLLPQLSLRLKPSDISHITRYNSNVSCCKSVHGRWRCEYLRCVRIANKSIVFCSTGKRTCIGQRLVQSCSFTLIASLLSNFNVSADLESVHTVPACVALPPDTFAITLTPRHRHGE